MYLVVFIGGTMFGTMLGIFLAGLVAADECRGEKV